MNSISKGVTDPLWRDTQAVVSKGHLSLVYGIIFLSLLLRLLSIGSYDLLVEEAYYWNYAQHLDFSYLDHPVMVALLIKASGFIFGINEFSVRLPALLCWVGSAFFCFKLTELVHRGSGHYAVLLLSLLPYFFLQSIVTTPDQPVILCWSASLYYLYQALVLEKPRAWYFAGLWLGLGMLSKYTIVLLGPVVLVYLMLVPSSRYWFARKEPYVCAIMATLLFTPVIYWNAQHEWASFIFQSTRRFQSPNNFSFHYFLGLVIVYLLPSGVEGLCRLWHKKTLNAVLTNKKAYRFLQLATLIPLAFFGLFSVNHYIKLDWIGPGLIAIIPWLALLISYSNKLAKIWLVYALFLLVGYGCFIFFVTFGFSEKISHIISPKFISWQKMTAEANQLSHQVAITENAEPVVIPLDLYNIGSELAFYQAKLHTLGKIEHVYPIVGRHLFDMDSLMFRYWSNNKTYSGQIALLISPILHDFAIPSLTSKVEILSKPTAIWSYNQGSNLPISPYYYQIVRIK